MPEKCRGIVNDPGNITMLRFVAQRGEGVGGGGGTQRHINVVPQKKTAAFRFVLSSSSAEQRAGACVHLSIQTVEQNLAEANIAPEKHCSKN